MKKSLRPKGTIAQIFEYSKSVKYTIIGRMQASEITTSVVVPCVSPKILPVHRFSVVIFTFSGPM